MVGWERPDVAWFHNEMIVETAGQSDNFLGQKEKDWERLCLPIWTPKRSVPSSRFHAGMIDTKGKEKGKPKDRPYIEEGGKPLPEKEKEPKSKDRPYIERREGSDHSEDENETGWTLIVPKEHVLENHEKAEWERLKRRFEF